MHYIHDLEPDDSPVKGNYAPTLESNTLLHKLVTRQYQEYLFGYVLKDGVWKPALGGGYQIDENGIAILTRLFVVPHYRMRLFIQHLLAALVDSLTQVEGLKPDTRVYITFNQYNSALYEWFVRKAQGRGASFGKQWPEVFSVFKPAGLQLINNVEQYVCETTWEVLLNEIFGTRAVRQYSAVLCKGRQPALDSSRGSSECSASPTSSDIEPA